MITTATATGTGTQTQGRTLRLDLHTYWLCGSGRGEGPEADEVPLLTPEGLPFVPGRTLRGLIRSAIELLGRVDPSACPPDRIVALLGSAPDGNDLWFTGRGDEDDDFEASMETGRFQNRAGSLRVGSATLGRTPAEKEAWRAWARSSMPTPESPEGFVEVREHVLSHLRTRLSFTKVDTGGVAANKTLRTVEVVVPLTLHAYLEASPDGLDLVGRALPYIRGLGSMRNRGFGRMSARWED